MNAGRRHAAVLPAVILCAAVQPAEQLSHRHRHRAIRHLLECEPGQPRLFGARPQPPHIASKGPNVEREMGEAVAQWLKLDRQIDFAAKLRRAMCPDVAIDWQFRKRP